MPPRSTVSSHSNPRSKPPSKTAHSHTINRKAVKQPTPPSERLKRLFTSLCAQIDGGHFANAVKTCDKILRIEPNDKDALQTKLFLLLQTEQYDAALSLIGTGDKSSDSEHAFERTYSLYRIQHEQEAAEGLKALKEEKDAENERAVLHLEAQLDYRRGSYEAAFELYNQLLDTAEPQSEEHSDILTNLTASQKHLDFINTGFLRALDALPTFITTNIETNPPPSHPTTSSAASAAAAQANIDDPTTTTQPKKKVRMSRVPKGVVPGVTPPPDPERWLKKSERSTFGQGRKRRGGGGAGGGTQGSTVEAGPPGGGAASGSSHNVKSGGGKGKKKK